MEGLDTKKKIILKGRRFRGGTDEKMRRMWFGLEIDVVGLPPLLQFKFDFIKLCIIVILKERTKNDKRYAKFWP